MAQKDVQFTATPSGVLRYWIAVDEVDVTMVNHQGGLRLEEGDHVLVWWMIGNPGDALGIVGREGGRAVVEVKESKVPSGSSRGAGYRRFKV